MRAHHPSGSARLARPWTLETDMESALRPREIQSRIRSGQTLDEVARVAGVPAERIEPFAAPVLAEREHVAGMALAASVRRRGESAAHRNLRPVIREKLTNAGIDPDSIEWDAWRNEDKRWSIEAKWEVEGEPRIAVFHFDLAGRFSVAADDQARWLLSETPTPAEAEAAEADELALVRVVEDAAEDLADPDNEPTVSFGEGSPGSTSSTSFVPGETGDWNPRSGASPLEIREQVEAEIDAYGLVPEGRSELDVLYDMLGGIAEDSINIYAGLSDPVVAPSPSTGSSLDSEPSEASSVSDESVDSGPATASEASPASEPRTPPAAMTAEAPPEAPPATPETPRAETSQPETPEAELPPHDDTNDEATVVRLERPSAAAVGTAGRSRAPQSKERPQQPLVGEPEETVPIKPGQSKRGGRKKRASVPSWDEIMFGSPRQD
ncbi:septation protein SepH [Ammonicoccus fulvus]|uniref:Septation protein SepH n=1 Tax=Ammonicoccus fulvus TaxID=3138240 RepID=A0ABZ3FPB0_9ACTN